MKNNFRFTGIDVKKTKEGIEISMGNYARSLEEIKIREDRRDETLTTEELKCAHKAKTCVSHMSTINKSPIWR